jgi:hypothetical protein
MHLFQALGDLEKELSNIVTFSNLLGGLKKGYVKEKIEGYI